MPQEDRFRFLVETLDASIAIAESSSALAGDDTEISDVPGTTVERSSVSGGQEDNKTERKCNPQ
jgi:hypothetical protein